jgi:hypothetical protein
MPTKKKLNLSNPFSLAAVSDERWRKYVDFYLAERRRDGADEEGDADDASEMTQYK